METGNLNPCYGDLLQAAYSLGRADGLFAARFEPEESPRSDCPVCQGRDPEEFARWLWADQPGQPPSGLLVNAPLWYARGFAEGLADERRRTAERRRDDFAWILLRRRVIPRGRG
ncbi:hypothetical protein [Geodermatophilus sp. URMC 64]